MGARIIIQKKVLVTGNTATGWGTAQTSDQWSDFGNYADGLFTLRVHSRTVGGTDQINIGLGTVDERPELSNAMAVPSGPVWDIKRFNAVANASWYKYASSLVTASGTGDGKPIDRWVFWWLTCTGSDGTTPGTGGVFTVEFEIAGTAKRPA